ncbi:MAG: hypothetical protein ACKOFW_19765 [Planctomycetaceae bacterium]
MECQYLNQPDYPWAGFGPPTLGAGDAAPIGPGGWSGFLETPRIRFGGVFLASAQTAAQSAVPGASTPRV